MRTHQKGDGFRNTIERRFLQNVKSPVTAVDVMQVMPPTGKELNVGNISEVEPNIHAAVKYMRFMMDRLQG